MKILFIGPQGAGKSTQGKLLAEHLNVPYISTGDIFRNFVNEGTEESKKVQEILSSGHLVDDQTTAEIVRKRLQEPDTRDGFVLDGYPRTRNQVDIFDPGFDKVIYLDLSDSEAIVRLLLRGRDDDTKELIAQRLKLYREQTEPILEYYAKPNVFKNIKAHFSVEQIREEIRKAIDG